MKILLDTFNLGNYGNSSSEAVAKCPVPEVVELVTKGTTAVIHCSFDPALVGQSYHNAQVSLPLHLLVVLSF